MPTKCPRTTVPNAVCETPVVGQKGHHFRVKSTGSPRKGLELALKACQDKLLDVLGPLTKIFELAKAASLTEQLLDSSEVTSWIQRAMYYMGNVNPSLAIECRKAILFFKSDPKLANLTLQSLSGRSGRQSTVR